MSTVRDSLLDLATGKDRAALEERFLEAVAEDPSQLDLFLEVGVQLRSMRRAADAARLLSLVRGHFDAEGSADDRARLYRFLVDCNDKDMEARKELVRALQEQNAENPAFELFVAASGLKDGASIETALTTLDKLQAYNVGSYVYHGSGWGVGRVEDVDALAGELVIRFEDGRRHPMPVKSALEILKTIDDDDWRVLKSFGLEEFRKLCESNGGEVLARILKQTGRSLDTASFKEMLMGSVIPKDKWNKWWSGARKDALKRPDVEQDGKSNKLVYRNPGDSDVLEDMRRVMTAGQVLDLANSYLRSVPDAEKDDSEHQQAFVQCLVEGSRKHAAARDASGLELLLMADELAEEQGFPRETIAGELKLRFLNEVKTLPLIPRLKNLRAGKRALAHLKNTKGDQYGEFLLQLIPDCSSLLLEHAITEAMAAGQQEALKKLLSQAVRKSDELPELLVWSRKRHGTRQFREILDHLDSKIILHKALALGENKGKRINPTLRKLARSVATDLCVDDCRPWRKFLKDRSGEEIRILGSFIEGLRGLSDATRLALLDVCRALQPAAPIVETPSSRVEYGGDVLYSTREGIEKRNKEYEELVNVKLPQVFEAIGKAASFGDLSENAEYTAALEERASMTKKAEEMKEELQRAKPIDASLLKEGLVTIGTKVSVKDQDSGQIETYTLLGPWDANFDQGILDYRAPLAAAFLGHKAGEVAETSIGGNDKRYEILSVENILS